MAKDFISDQEMERNVASGSAKTGGPPQFVSDQDMEAYQKKSQIPLADKATNALEGVGNFLTAGYLPKLQAAWSYTDKDPTEDVDNRLRAQGVTITQPEWHNYADQERYYNNLRDNTVKNDPEDYYGGSLAAAGLMAIPSALSAAKATPAVATGLLNVAKSDAVQKALQVGGPMAAYLLGRRSKEK